MPEASELDNRFIIDTFQDRWPEITEDQEKLDALQRAVAMLAITKFYSELSLEDLVDYFQHQVNQEWEFSHFVHNLNMSTLAYFSEVAYPYDYYHTMVRELGATMGGGRPSQNHKYAQAALHHFSPLPQAPPFHIPAVTQTILANLIYHRPHRLWPQQTMGHTAMRKLVGMDGDRPYSMKELLSKEPASMHEEIHNAVTDELRTILNLCSRYRSASTLEDNVEKRPRQRPILPRPRVCKRVDALKFGVDPLVAAIHRYEPLAEKLSHAQKSKKIEPPSHSPPPKEERPSMQAVTAPAAELPLRPIDPATLSLIPDVPLPPDLVGGVTPSNNTSLHRQPLDAYFHEIRRYRLLRAEEEVSLSQRIEAGLYAQRLLETWIDDNGKSTIEPELQVELEHLAKEGHMAYARMLCHNLRLVPRWALGRSTASTAYIDGLDLIQAGNEGVVSAVEHFDFTLGYKFSSYATNWIRERITKEIHKRASELSVPDYVAVQLTSLERAERELNQKLGRRPSNEEIGQLLGIGSKKVDELFSICKRAISLDAALKFGNEFDGSLQERLEIVDSTHIDIRVTSAVLHDELHSMLDILPERQKKIVLLWFGIGQASPLTEVEIASKLYLTGALVRQQLHTALAKLRRNPRAQSIKELFDE